MIKFELERLPRNCGNDEILDEIRRVSSLIDLPHVSRKEFDRFSKISSSTIIKRFSGWGIALDKAGLADSYKGPSVTKKMHQQKGKHMSDSDLITEMTRVAKEIETKTLTIEQFNKHAAISAETIRRRFGSWWKALDKAGLKISNHGKRHTDEEYFENLLNIWMHHGRQPKYREMDERPSTITSGAYEAKWGNWHKALRAFVERTNADIKPVSANSVRSQSSLNKPSQQPQTKVRVRAIPLGLRYDVLQRDHFKCVLCGDNPAVNPRCKLHIDHVVPFTQNGDTVKDNLRTLCSRCNLGKSDKKE